MADLVEQPPHVHLYAELLQNIRTLSIQASLATPSNKATKATVSSDGSTLTLRHEGETASIQLPATILGSQGGAILPIPVAPSRDLSFRLSVADKPHVDSLHNGHDTTIDSSIAIPWMTSDLTAETELYCAHCKSVLIPRGAIKEWKDLPSEGWAEMMGFWHCHKPDVPHSHDSEGNAGRGFGAHSKLIVQQGIGLVGPTDFLFAADDCNKYETGRPCDQDIPNKSITCMTCKALVGITDQDTGGLRLRKACLGLSAAPADTPITYNSERWLACHLLSASESQGVRKFLVYAMSSPVNSQSSKPAVALRIWIFAPALTVSFSSASFGEATEVVKILHRPADANDVDKLDGQGEGEIELPLEEWQELRRLLRDSAMLLPHKAKVFQDWNVGILRRFTTGKTKIADHRRRMNA